MYKFGAFVVKVILSIFGRAKVYHKNRLPDSGGYVIACTHTGWVDILWLGVSALPVQIHYMAKKELFKSGFLRWLMKKLNAFPVDRDNPGPSSLKIPHRILQQEEVVGIFPGGTRSSEEVPLKRGAVTIATRSQVPIVPAAYAGPANFKELLKRKKPRVIFGEPIYASREKPRKEAIETLMDDLNEAMKDLQKEIE